MSLLGQLWVKLGLKNEEFKQGIDEAKGKSQSFGEDIKRVSGKVKAAWAAVGAAVIKLGVDMTKQTQIIGDKWNIFTAGLSAAYGEFVSRIGTGAGWDNLIANMREAARVAKEVQASLDEIFERENSLSIQEAKKQTEIERYKQIMRDVSRTDEERIAAGEKAMALEGELLNLRKDVARQEADAYKAILQQRTKMTDADVEYFIQNYNGNREQINQAIAYRDEMKALNREIENARVFESQATGEAKRGWKEKIDLLEQNRASLSAATSDELKALADLATRYDLGNDEMVNNYVQALIKMENAGSQYYRQTTRMVTMLATLKKEMGDVSGDAVAQAGREVFTPIQALPALNMPGATTQSGGGVDVSSWMADQMKKNRPIIEDQVEFLQQQAEKADAAAAMFSTAVAGSIIDSMNMLAEAIASGESLSFGQVAANLLTPLADTAIQAGMMIMATGEGIEALKASLMGFLGIGAIAAGATLVALGIAAKAGLSALATSGGGSTGVNNYSYSGGYGIDMRSQTSQQEVKVTGVIKGQDIYLANEKYQQSRNR